MQAQHFCSHFSHIGLINLISQPSCHIFTDASLDTHFDMTYVRHLSSMTSAICQFSQNLHLLCPPSRSIFAYFESTTQYLTSRCFSRHPYRYDLCPSSVIADRWLNCCFDTFIIVKESTSVQLELEVSLGK